MKVLVDTSALLALLDEDEERHREAVRTFEWLTQSAELVTHNYVRLEAMALVDRRLGRDLLRRLVDEILPAIAAIPVDEALDRSALEARLSLGGSPSLVDRVSFALMRREGIETAFAFDTDFVANGFRIASPPPRGRGVHEAPVAYGAGGDDGDLVSVAEIAARSGRSVNTVQSWRRRHPHFPAPAAQLATGPIWRWPAVQEWIGTRN